MKKFKFIVFLVAAALMLSILPMGASAAVGGNPGKTVTVTFSFPNSYGVNGEFTFSNSGILASYDISAGGLGGDIANNRIALFGASKTNISVVITATLRADAVVGSSCTINFAGDRVTDAYGNTEEVTRSETITVTAPPAETTAPPVVVVEPTHTPGGDTPDTPPVQPPVQPEPTVKIDYTELIRQIDIANGLKKDGYTDPSWNAMLSALAEARSNRYSNSQAAVDVAAKKLADAIAALETVDYTALKKAVDEAIKYNEGDAKELMELWDTYNAALTHANEMFASGDQEAVNKAAADLEAALKALRDKLESMEKTVVKEVVKEVEKEVDPKGPFCNINIHRVWLILLIISAVLNIGFIVLIVLWFLKKKKNTKDDTPLVDYNISDDDR